jgi:hypothetical protein
VHVREWVVTAVDLHRGTLCSSGIAGKAKPLRP